MRNKPFALTLPAKRLNTTYLAADEFRSALLSLDGSELTGFLRTYVEEGIPFLFGGQPMIWEALRDWLGNRLSVPANHIAVIGSARLGFTVKPTEFGRALSENSDLDLSVIDFDLFEKSKKDALKFAMDVDFKKISANNIIQQTYWTQNSETLQRNIKLGFVDTKLIPSMHEKYPTPAEVNDLLSVVHSRLVKSEIKIKSASARVFRDWDCFVERISLNYRVIKKKLEMAKGSSSI